MKQALYLLSTVFLLTTIPLQAQDNKQAQTLLEQAQNALFSNPKHHTMQPRLLPYFLKMHPMKPVRKL